MIENFNIIAFKNTIKDLTTEEQIRETIREYREVEKLPLNNKTKNLNQIDYMEKLLANVQELRLKQDAE